MQRDVVSAGRRHQKALKEHLDEVGYAAVKPAELPSWVSEVGALRGEIQRHFQFLETAAVGELMGELQATLTNMASSHDRYADMLQLAAQKAETAAEAAGSHSGCGSSLEEARSAYDVAVASLEGALLQELVGPG